MILLQAYGFLMPAFDPSHRRRMLPMTVAIPVLFAAGVAFGYEVVLPAALHFFQNFNSGEFNVLVQASQYYKFAATTLLAMGLLFQIPVAIIAVTRAGIVTPRQLRHNRRYALLACGLRCRGAARVTRSRCCSRRCRSTCCSRPACSSRRSPTVASEPEQLALTTPNATRPEPGL